MYCKGGSSHVGLNIDNCPKLYMDLAADQLFKPDTQLTFRLVIRDNIINFCEGSYSAVYFCVSILGPQKRRNKSPADISRYTSVFLAHLAQSAR